ncbi:MAG: hypothetical protein K5663_05860 [Clostridiales bacterium]|nr:hypothetical protein [Clostridiales bacterium]
MSEDRANEQALSATNVYCVFCRSQFSDDVAKMACQLYGGTAFCPKQIQHTFKDGKMIDLVHKLLPGYVFIFTDDEIDTTIRRSVPNVLKLLGDEKNGFRLAGNDLAFAMMLLKNNGVLGKTAVNEADGILSLASNSDLGTDARILKVERRKHRMKVEFRFDKQTISTWVEYVVAND